jgi:hypothetical protein
MMIDFCPFCNERLTAADLKSPRKPWECRAHETCRTAAGLQPPPAEVVRVLDAGLVYLRQFPKELHGEHDVDAIEKMRDGDVPFDSDSNTGKRVAATLIATCLVQLITYSIEQPIGADDLISEERLKQFGTMLSVLRWADEQSLGISLAAACERVARRRNWNWDED